MTFVEGKARHVSMKSASCFATTSSGENCFLKAGKEKQKKCIDCIPERLAFGDSGEGASLLRARFFGASEFLPCAAYHKKRLLK